MNPVRIPVWKESNLRDHSNLRDLNTFLEDFDQFFDVEQWLVEIEWCMGDRADEIHRRTEGRKKFLDSDFRELYEGIYQTVDGEFEILINRKTVARLVAIDSTYWEIEAKNDQFIEHVLAKYGTYKFTKT